MKGVAIRTVILLVLAVIVMGIALWFLTYVTNFDSLFLSNDQRLLKQYATCALAYCAAGGVGTNGQTSDEVKAVGCLKYENGRCTMSCADVEKQVYVTGLFNNGIPVQPTVYEVGGRGAPHYCGPAAKLSFEFNGVSLGGTVPLVSGQMDKIATQPQWVCKPVKIPFTDIELDSIGIPTTDVQFHGLLGQPQNCVILSGRVSPIFPGREGCFLPIKYDKSYDSIYYTPIIEYDSGNQIIYPSAIYLDKSFTATLPGSSSAECDYRNSPNYNPVTDQQILDVINAVIQHPQFPGMPTGMTYQQYYDQLGSENKTDEQKRLVDFINTHDLADLSNSNNNLIGNVLNGCNFKTQYQGKKISYFVWAKPVYPTLNALESTSVISGADQFIKNILAATSPDLITAYTFVTENWNNGADVILGQLGGSCTSVVLGRDLPQISSSNGGPDIVQDLAISSDQKTYPAGSTIKFSGQLIMSSGSAAGREITIDYIYPTLNGILQSTKATTDSDGKFSGEFKIPSSGGGTGFVLEASFQDKKVFSDPFNIGG